MGSSFTEFRGVGFWSRDQLLETWLELLAEVVPADAPGWLREAEQHWRMQARAGFQGCVNADLDARLTSDDRIETVLALTEQASAYAARLAAQTGKLPADWLNTRGVGGEGTVWPRDLELESVRQVANALTALLRGNLQTTAKTSPVLH